MYYHHYTSTYTNITHTTNATNTITTTTNTSLLPVYHHHYTTTTATTTTIITWVSSQLIYFESFCQLFNTILGCSLLSASPAYIKLTVFIIIIRTSWVFPGLREPPCEVSKMLFPFLIVQSFVRFDITDGWADSMYIYTDELKNKHTPCTDELLDTSTSWQTDIIYIVQYVFSELEQKKTAYLSPLTC